MRSSENKTEMKIKENDKQNIYKYFYLLFAVLNYSLMNFFRNSISPITDVLQSQYNTTSSGIGLLSSLFYMTYLFFQLPSGILLEKYSHKYLLLIILIVSIGISLCSLLFGLIIVHSLIFPVIIRIICGIFSAPDWIIGIIVSAKYFGNNNMAMYVGIMSISANVCALIGTTFQAYLYQKYNIWREPFYLIASISGITSLLVIICMFCDKNKISENKENKLVTKNEIVPKLIANENICEIHQNITPNIQKCVFLVISNYLNWCLGIIGFCLFAIFAAFNGLWFTPYLMSKYNYSRSLSAFIAGLTNAFAGFFSILMGYLAKKFKKRKILLIIGVLCQSTTLIIIYVEAKYISKYIIIFINLISGFGSSCNVLTFTLAHEYNKNKQCNQTAQGFVNAITVSAGLLIQYIIGFLLDYHYIHTGNTEKHHNGTRKYSVNDYNYAFTFVIPTSCLLALLTTLLLKETNAKNILS